MSVTPHSPRQGSGPSVDASTLLRGTKLFAELDEAALDHLGIRARARNYRRGETIFLEGDPGEHLFAVVSGLVKVFVTSARGEELVLATLTQGEVFGELALIDGEGRSASAEALELTTLLSVDRASFVGLLSDRPELIDRLLHVMGALVRRITEQTGDLVFLDLQGRVAKLLLSLAEEGSGDAGAGMEIQLHFSQSDLARMVGSSRQTVNQILRGFQAAGYISVSEKRLTVLRPDALLRRAGQ